MADRVGQQLGTYRLIRLLGRGGFAEVYLGEHLRLGTQVAIKVLHTSLEDDDVEGFLREAQMVARLRHPHIVRVFDFDVENHMPFLVMDYLPNGNVRRSHPKGTPLPLPTIVSYVTQVASALQYSHDEKLIHRDIKPENMLLDRDNTLVLSDFGIALMSQSSRYQSTQEVAGTAAYMAPEQFQGHPRRASDQYALAVVVYEWLTGDRPFHGSFSEIASQHLFVPPLSLREKVPTIPLEVEQVVLTALAKDPAARFASVQAFASALQTAEADPPLDSRSAKISGVSVAGAASSAAVSPVDGASPPNQTKGQGVPDMPPPAVVGNLEVSARVPLSEKHAPTIALYAETVAASEELPASEVSSPVRQYTAVLSSSPPLSLNKPPRTSNKWIRILGIVLTFAWLLLLGGGGVYTINSVQDPLNNTPAIPYSIFYQQVLQGNVATATIVGQAYVIGTFKTSVITMNVNGGTEILRLFHAFQPPQGDPTLLPLLRRYNVTVESKTSESPPDPEAGIVFIVVLVLIYVSALVLFLLCRLYTQSRSKTVLISRSPRTPSKWMRVLGIVLTCLWLLLVGGATLHTIQQNPLQLPPHTIEIPYSTFYEQIDSGNVNTVTLIGSTDIIGTFRHLTTGKTNTNETGSSLSFHLNQLPQGDPTLLSVLLRNNVTFIAEPYPDSREGIIFIVALVLVYEIALLFFLLWRQYMRSRY